MNLDYVERPRTLDEVVGHENVKKDIRAYLKTGDPPHIMLAGPPGIGKNCIAQGAASEYLGREITIDTGEKDEDYFEFNCSLWTGIDTIRNEISDILKLPGKTVVNGIRRKKVIFLNEFEKLSDAAKAGLKSEIEVWEKNAWIIGATNFIEQIKEDALESRFAIFKLKPPSVRETSIWFGKVAEKYDVIFETSTLIEQVAEYYGCNLRRMLVDCLEALRGYPESSDGMIHISKKDLWKIFSDSGNYAQRVHDSEDPKRMWVHLWKQEHFDNRRFLEDYMKLLEGKHSQLFAKIDSRLRRGCNPLIQMSCLFDIIKQSG